MDKSLRRENAEAEKRYEGVSLRGRFPCIEKAACELYHVGNPPLHDFYCRENPTCRESPTGVSPGQIFWGRKCCRIGIDIDGHLCYTGCTQREMSMRVLDYSVYSLEAIEIYAQGKKRIQLEALDEETGGFVPMTLGEGDVRRLVGVLANWLDGKGLKHVKR